MVFIQWKWVLSCLNVLQMVEWMEEYFVKWLEVLEFNENGPLESMEAQGMCRDLTKEWKDVIGVKWCEKSELNWSCRRWAVSSQPADCWPTASRPCVGQNNSNQVLHRVWSAHGRSVGSWPTCAEKWKSSIVPEQSVSGRSAGRLAAR